MGSDWTAILVIIFFLAIGYFFMILIGATENDLIKNKVKEIGGHIISIERNNSYEKDVFKIDNKKRHAIHSIYKITYTLDEKEMVGYHVVYRDFYVPLGKTWKRDWVEKPE